MRTELNVEVGIPQAEKMWMEEIGRELVDEFGRSSIPFSFLSRFYTPSHNLFTAIQFTRSR
jgi:hypothetical protein